MVCGVQLDEPEAEGYVSGLLPRLQPHHHLTGPPPELIHSPVNPSFKADKASTFQPPFPQPANASSRFGRNTSPLRHDTRLCLHVGLGGLFGQYVNHMSSARSWSPSSSQATAPRLDDVASTQAHGAINRLKSNTANAQQRPP